MFFFYGASSTLLASTIRPRARLEISTAPAMPIPGSSTARFGRAARCDALRKVSGVGRRHVGNRHAAQHREHVVFERCQDDRARALHPRFGAGLKPGQRERFEGVGCGHLASLLGRFAWGAGVRAFRQQFARRAVCGLR